jgi:hypothetical protein
MASRRKAQTRGKRTTSKRAPRAGSSGTAGVLYERVRHLAKKLDGVEDGTSYGTPALKVKGVLMARLKEDSETLVLRTSFVDRDLLMRDAPAIYYITEHYRNYPWVLVRLSAIPESELADRLEEAWQRARRTR